MKNRLATCCKNYILLGAAAVLMAGCGNPAEKEDNLVILQQETQEENGYSLVLASVQDVVLEETVRMQYQAVNSLDQSFQVAGKKIRKVYVTDGDTIAAGELIAELDADDTADSIRQLEYEIERNQLLLKQLEEQKDDEIAVEDLKFSQIEGYYFVIDEAREDYDKRIANIEESYQYRILDYQDQISVAQMRIEALQAQEGAGDLYAEASGVITYLKGDLEGTLTELDTRVITITDNRNCLFVSNQTEAAHYFEEGTVVDLNITIGGIADVCQIVPYQLNQTENGLEFRVVSNQTFDTSLLEPGMTGSITIPLDRKEHVLSIPVATLHEADGEYYVYVLNEEQQEEIRWIKVGLIGNTLAETVEGVSEGDKVILR